MMQYFNALTIHVSFIFKYLYRSLLSQNDSYCFHQLSQAPDFDIEGPLISLTVYSQYKRDHLFFSAMLIFMRFLLLINNHLII